MLTAGSSPPVGNMEGVSIRRVSSHRTTHSKLRRRELISGSEGAPLNLFGAVTGKLLGLFITYGANREIVGQLKKLLTFGGVTPVVAVGREIVSKPFRCRVARRHFRPFAATERDCLAAVDLESDGLNVLVKEGGFASRL